MLRICHATLKCPFMYQPRLRALVMKTGLAAIDMAGTEDKTC